MDPRELERRVDTFLGEFRIVVPALAALLGFQLIAAMQQTYSELSPLDRAINFGGVVSTMLALAFMLVPTAYHRLAPHLHEDEAFIPLAQRCLGLGTLFFALSLALGIYIQAARSFRNPAASAFIAIAALACLSIAWWAYPRVMTRRPRDQERSYRGLRRGPV